MRERQIAHKNMRQILDFAVVSSLLPTYSMVARCADVDIYRILETEKIIMQKIKLDDVSQYIISTDPIYSSFNPWNLSWYTDGQNQSLVQTSQNGWKKMWPSRAYTVCVVLSIATTSCVFQQEAHVFHNKISNWIFRGLSRSSSHSIIDGGCGRLASFVLW